MNEMILKEMSFCLDSNPAVWHKSLKKNPLDLGALVNKKKTQEVFKNCHDIEVELHLSTRSASLTCSIPMVSSLNMVGWLCFTSHRQLGHFSDGTPIYCPLRRT